MPKCWLNASGTGVKQGKARDWSLGSRSGAKVGVPA